jgi:hypothetical protein
MSRAADFAKYHVALGILPRSGRRKDERDQINAERYPVSFGACEK